MKNEKNQQKQLQKKIGEFAENFCCQRLNICLLKKIKIKQLKTKKETSPVLLNSYRLNLKLKIMPTLQEIKLMKLLNFSLFLNANCEYDAAAKGSSSQWQNPAYALKQENWLYFDKYGWYFGILCHFLKLC